MTVVYYPDLGRSGRFGNQAIQIMATVGITNQMQAWPFFPHWEYASYFNVRGDWFGDTHPVPLEWVRAQDTPLARRALPDRRARPYLQSLALFDHLRDDIRDWFSLSELGRKELDDHLSRTGQTHLPDLLTRPDTIALHVRRGDNADPETHPVGTWPLPSMHYYRVAVNHFAPVGHVVVFSDDIDWCAEHRDLFPFGSAFGFYTFVHSGPQRPPEYRDGTDGHGPSAYKDTAPLDWIDCYLMSMAPRLITANSTYSWLAGYLGGAETVTPSNWVGWKLRWVSWEKLIPSDWKILPNPVAREHLVDTRERKRR